MKRQENHNSWLIDMLNSKGLQIAEAETEFKRSLEQLSEGQRRFGFRTESMFAYVAGAMSQCNLIKQEDCGQWYVDQDSYSIPDYRVFLKSGKIFLVEVKNETKKTITFKKDYLKKLKTYSDLNQLPLKIAIYWQTAGVWTFNDPSNFEDRNGKWFMSIDTAIAKSEISVLGDEMIATKPLLSIRMICDLEKTSELDDGGRCQICFSDVEHYCDGKLITNEIERKIAFQFMLSSQWNEQERIEMDGNKVSWIEYSFTPEHYDPEQGFAIVGSLSSIISLKYKRATSGDDGVHSISPANDPEDFEVFIPENYKGDALPLWRFIMQPNKNFKSSM